MAFPTHVLVSPLNWGLGHASRSIPIINHFLKKGCKVTIASDGNALKLLKDEFPHLDALELNSSSVTYSRFSFYFYLKLILQGFGLQKRAINDEKLIQAYVEQHQVDLIVSDHRFGAFSKQIKSVVICHQLQFKAGLFSWSSSYFNAKNLNRFTEVWVPDTPTSPNLSGVLSQSRQVRVPVKTIGVLSRFEHMEVDKSIDYLAVISGPEPLRTQLEKKLIHLFSDLTSKRCVIVRGVYNQKQIEDLPHLKFHNHLQSKALNLLICQAKLVLCRSGYSSVMDMACLSKKVLFIPTPHQGEQNYLAKRLKQMRIAAYVDQDKLKTTDLENIKQYAGFNSEEIRQFPLPGLLQL